METFKGTPGPWRRSNLVTTGTRFAVVPSSGRQKIIAATTKPAFSVAMTADEIEANMDAIAAIPEMLDAMASAISTLNELNPHCIPTTYENPTERHQRECVTDAYSTLLAAYNLAIKGPAE